MGDVTPGTRVVVERACVAERQEGTLPHVVPAAGRCSRGGGAVSVIYPCASASDGYLVPSAQR